MLPSWTSAHRGRAAAVALTLSLFGCGSSAAPQGAASDAGSVADVRAARDPFDAAGAYEPIALELGTGLEAFQPVPETGGRVELVHGPQGGYHLLGRYRFTGMQPDVNVYFRVTPTGGGAALNAPTDRFRRTQPRTLTANGAGWENIHAELVILTEIGLPTEVVGHTVRWEIVLEEVATGRLATAHRDITVADDEP